MINHLIGIHPSFGLLTMRIILGIIFILHGYKKLLKKDVQQQFSSFLMGSGFPLPATMVYLIGVVELFGGMCIVAGLYTRLAAAADGISLLAALFTMKKQAERTSPLPLNDWASGVEHIIALGTMALILLMMGAGKFSLDVIVLNEW